jgi:hypothetical protein
MHGSRFGAALALAWAKGDIGQLGVAVASTEDLCVRVCACVCVCVCACVCKCGCVHVRQIGIEDSVIGKGEKGALPTIQQSLSGVIFKHHLGNHTIRFLPLYSKYIQYL